MSSARPARGVPAGLLNPYDCTGAPSWLPGAATLTGSSAAGLLVLAVLGGTPAHAAESGGDDVDPSTPAGSLSSPDAELDAFFSGLDDLDADDLDENLTQGDGDNFSFAPISAPSTPSPFPGASAPEPVQVELPSPVTARQNVEQPVSFPMPPSTPVVSPALASRVADGGLVSTTDAVGLVSSLPTEEDAEVPDGSYDQQYLPAPFHVCGTTFVPKGDTDRFVGSLVEMDATTDQVRHARGNPCDPRLPSEPELTKSQNATAAFGLEHPPGAANRGLDNYTDFLNTPFDLSNTPPVYNYRNWQHLFVDITPFPVSFQDQFLAAVPPAGSRQASPFSRIHFNLTGMGGKASLEAAIRLGAQGYTRGSVTNWELYNVIGSARDKTVCHSWKDTPHLTIPGTGVGVVGGYFERNCPEFPAGLGRPGPRGSAGR